MERAKVIKDELVEQNIHFLSVYLETKNSCLILLSENEDRLGTLAIAIPKPPDTPGLPSSSVILGNRNVISARMFAEYLASKKGKIAIVSVYLERMDEMQAQAIFKRLIERVTLTEPKIEGFESREGSIT
ncbi:hypothetical protein KEJ32_05335 [Candidatus Bathyarchaeota archaeon]|nr:hypothetical protein [Candidatus Bathyarchaeota archaeon]